MMELTPMSALKEILAEGKAGTQEEIVLELERRGLEVTQSTVSRGLKRLGAIKTLNADGEAVYRLPGEIALPAVQASLGNLIAEIVHNGSMIIIRSSPGSASLLARHLDHHRPGGILGTIAGDDTIFVAPASSKGIETAVRRIREFFGS
jgi:transcriptional regulator of arginine metabolism